MAKTTSPDGAKKTALDRALKALFGRLQARPAPDRLTSIVEQLDAADAPPPERKAS